jgi:TonB family protein
MALRCLLFSSDEGAAEPIRQVLTGLGVEGEACPDGETAVERVTSESFQIVIIDWDQQPEAGFVLKAARERKASERPLTLAIVSDDVSVPKALQAGANSILRKPILISQVNDTLTTARDLLRAKQESATNVAQAAAAAASAGSATSLPVTSEQNSDKTLRAGEFLNSATSIPGAQFDTESDMQKSLEQSAVAELDPLKDLEPMAAAVAQAVPPPAPPRPADDEPRGLEYYLKARGIARAPMSSPPSPAPAPAQAKPELLGFDQTPYSETAAPANDGADEMNPPPALPRRSSRQPAPDHDAQEQKAEAKLFAYIEGEGVEPEEAPRRSFSFKGPIVIALALAACAIVAAPQAPWHAAVRVLFGHGQHALHAWLNPQPNTTAPAPESHENFGRAGDEYKLPVAENIPDATTDPSQIHVVPVVDPTAKKPSAAGTDQNTSPVDGTSTAPVDPMQPPGVPGQQNPVQQNQVQENQTPSATAQPAGATSAAPGSTSSTPTVSAPAQPQPSSSPTVAAPAPLQPAPVSAQPQQHASATPNPAIPSSLQSQMASITPEASGNKAPEAALPSIEPVVVPEGTERGLLADQPAIVYPDTAKGQQGTVILQVLIGRDGSVQDAKFLQGSLAFARAAIEGVRQWKFKPYMMNGRPASVQTSLTLTFKPGA